MKQYYIVITPFFPNKESFRGSFIYDQVKAIERNSNYQVLVFKPKPINSKEKDYNYNGIRVFLFYDIQMPSYFFNGFSNGINNITFLKKIKQSQIDINNIAIAHAHTARFASFSLALKKINPHIKTLVQHHDPDPFNIRNGFLSTFKWNAIYRTRMSSKLFNQIDCHICISKFVADSLCNFPKPVKNLFMWCGDLYEIPDDLFGMCVEAEDFSGCFTQSGIERIPEGLFDRCVKAKDFSWCFNDCASLEVVPENLFAYCGEVENVEGCFGGECGVEVSEDIFQGCRKVKKNWGFFF